MAREKKRLPADSVEARVEHALELTRGRLKLWLVFEDATEVAQARSLIQQKRARHLTALSRTELERRHEKAVREILERYAGAAPPPASVPEEPEEPEESPVPPVRAARRVKTRQHAEAVSG